MTKKEQKIFDIFCDKYDELIDSHLIEGRTGIANELEINVIASGLAGAFAINQLLKEDKE